MKEIKVNRDGKEVSVKLANPKGKHTKKAFKLLSKIDKGDGTEDLEAVDKYMDYLDEMAADCIGLTVDELDELDSEDKNKIVSYYQEQVNSRFDFLKPSQQQANSLPKATQE